MRSQNLGTSNQWETDRRERRRRWGRRGSEGRGCGYGDGDGNGRRRLPCSCGQEEEGEEEHSESDTDDDEVDDEDFTFDLTKLTQQMAQRQQPKLHGKIGLTLFPLSR